MNATMSTTKSEPTAIEVENLRKVFRQATTGQSVVAIDRLSLHIAPREVVAIVGQTGCGKSTFFDMMIAWIIDDLNLLILHYHAAVKRSFLETTPLPGVSDISTL